MVYDNVLEAMGNTPIIRLRNMADADSADILVKFEGLNVGGSIGTHLQMGIGDGIIPDILNQNLYNNICTITDEEALETSKLLAKKEGLMCGISSGTNVAAAINNACL